MTTTLKRRVYRKKAPLAILASTTHRERSCSRKADYLLAKADVPEFYPNEFNKNMDRGRIILRVARGLAGDACSNPAIFTEDRIDVKFAKLKMGFDQTFVLSGRIATASVKLLISILNFKN
jgi:hypothetical protein